MNKVELAAALASERDISKADAVRTVNALIDIIAAAVTRGDTVQLIGFGSFSSGKRAARTGRNPVTGEAIKIPARRTVKFSAGKSFVEQVNSAKPKKSN